MPSVGLVSNVIALPLATACLLRIEINAGHGYTTNPSMLAQLLPAGQVALKVIAKEYTENRRL
jgi:hypothetical protein